MDELDEQALRGIIFQLQLENEMLRHYFKPFLEMRQAVAEVPNFLEDLWQRLTADKMKLLIGVMILYWCASIGLMFYDRIGGKRV